MINKKELLQNLELDSDSNALLLCAINSAEQFYNIYCCLHNVTEDTNVHGESQKGLDVLADEIFTENFVKSGVCSLICSEEQEDAVESNGSLAVCFDPLDGSSVIEANFATGSVFGVYKSKNLIGLKPSDMHMAFYFVYGPNLSMVISVGSSVYSGKLSLDGWEFQKCPNLANGRILGLGNLSVLSVAEYQSKLQKCVEAKLSLRYSGALVSDVHMLIIKGGGVFVRPSLAGTKPKLRLVYECGPLAYIVENLAGKSSNGNSSILDVEIEHLHQTIDFFVGTPQLVDLWIES